MKAIIAVIITLLMTMAATAHSEGDFEEAERLIENKINCSKLSDGQLEMIGEYYMEQMHPGEAHELMDEMMGGEGSESLTNAHIRMAQSFYCGDSTAMSSGMMGMMMGRGSGMMGNAAAGSQYNMMGYANSYTGLNSVLLTILLLLLIAVAAVILLRLLSKQHKRR